MSYEIVKESLYYDSLEPISFLKWNFVDTRKFREFKDNIKVSKIYKIKLNGNTKSNINIQTLSGIISENKLEEFVQILIPYSFILHGKIKLISPYFSHDDDNFYLIQNPCLKEKVFKVPMIRGSSWKGRIAMVGKDLVNEDFEWFSSYIRVFGTGSDEYRKLLDKVVKEKDFKEQLIKYLLFELGMKLTKTDIEQINNEPRKYLEKLKLNNNDFKSISCLHVHKGRVIFYPTYFSRLSLEIINPHNRKTRAGTNPIHYEVVPKGAEGILQIVYIPFDGILTKESEVKKQVESDIKFLTKCIEKVAKNGMGAKTKLGWGKFEFKSRRYCINEEAKGLNLNDWQKCEVENG
ncbi:MAG TPA: hypothetical protein ENI51_08100 [Candidatus Atribacteria bacterium]|nr:hypothetical protein [Candidatus Atribacteria bacterium]